MSENRNSYDPMVSVAPAPEPEFVDRKGASEWLKEQKGIRLAPQTLANMHTKGTGPPVVLFGRQPLYPVAQLHEWARSRMSPLVHSSSEASPVSRNTG